MLRSAIYSQRAISKHTYEYCTLERLYANSQCIIHNHTYEYCTSEPPPPAMEGNASPPPPPVTLCCAYYMYVYISYVHTYVRTRARTYVPTYVCMFAYIHVCKDVCMYICTRPRTVQFMCVKMCALTYSTRPRTPPWSRRASLYLRGGEGAAD